MYIFLFSSDGITEILYAKVTQDTLPIQDARVIAFVYPPSLDSRPIKLLLQDGGTGYPDITKGDGIYSAYLTVQAQGTFSVILKTDYNHGKANLPKPYGNEASVTRRQCCGSKLPDYYNIPTSPFERVFAGQSFTNEKPWNTTTNKADHFPPSRITDLKLKNYVNRTLKATLEWTAPGDDYNSGRAFAYEIKCYTNPALLVNDFNTKGIPVHNSLLPTPKEAGVIQSIEVAIPYHNEVYYYAIVTMDESNNRSPVSNRVPVYVEEIKTTTQHDLMFKVINGSGGNSGGAHSGDHVSSKFEAVLDNDTMIYVISGCITAFMLVLIALFSIAMCRAKRKRALKERPTTQGGHSVAADGGPGMLMGMPSMTEPTEANIYVVNGSVNSAQSNTEQPLSSVTTTTSVLPDLTSDHLQQHINNNNHSASKFDLWKMDNLMESGYINTYFRGNGNSRSVDYPSLQAFPVSSTNPHTVGPMSLLSLNIKPPQHQPMTSSHSQTNLSALTSAQLPLQVFR